MTTQDYPSGCACWWRKNHPDLKHPTVNPRGGYPDALYNIHAWMLAHPDLPGGEQSLPSVSSNRRKSGKKVVKKQRRAGRWRMRNLRISGSSTSPRSENDIRLNYWDPAEKSFLRHQMT